MARAEIRRVIQRIWEQTSVEGNVRPHTANPAHDSSDQSNSDGSRADCTSLFNSSVNDKNTEKKREKLIQQYYDIYRNLDGEQSLKGDVTISLDGADEANGLLAHQVYPLNSCETEADWILKHRAFMLSCKVDSYESESVGSQPLLSNHVDKLLDSCFPSRLLRDQIVPIDSLHFDASCNFRALMMPERRYVSFRREGDLLYKICCKKDDDAVGVHWTLTFHNSSFDGEFAESLAQVLYLCPTIKGLTFSSQSASEDSRSLNEESSVLARLAGLLPPWISHLVFDSVLTESDLRMLISDLKTTGTMYAEDNASCKTTYNSMTNVPGRSFLAIKKTSNVSVDVWHNLFSLLNAGMPLSTLKSLDLSFNNLGDELCAAVLKLVYDEDVACGLEELDLSGNGLGSGENVIMVLNRVRELARIKTKVPALHTLILASNDLSIADAWHSILATLQHEIFRLRILDLSSNDIFSTDDNQIATLVGTILNNKHLVRINLSNNRFESKAVDNIVRQLDSSSTDGAMAFVELENNDPCLTLEQNESLQSFLAKSRCNLVERASGRAPHANDIPSGSEVSLGDCTVVRSALRIADASTVLSWDTTHDHYTPSPSENMISVLFSEPLVYKDCKRQMLRPFAKLNFELEREFIWHCLKEASRDIELSFENATHDRLLATITKGCSCLHYSGHGTKQCLPFEDGSGGPAWFPVQKFKELIDTGTSAPFRFVFVSACNSEMAGNVFASAGVPHVVCCKQECELKDVAALSFTRQFYLALALGKTVKQSFEAGCKAVNAIPNLGKEEMKKFMLLPLDGNHDIPIFNARLVREWPRSFYDEAKTGKQEEISHRRSELVMQNLIQEDPSPRPPQHFLGREVDTYNVLQQLLNNRVVSVIGETGIGRSSLVCAVCHYINERRNNLTTTYERIYFVKAQKQRKKNRFVTLVKNLKKLLNDGKSDYEDNEEEAEQVIEAVCKRLKSAKVLLVFDRVELLDDSEELNEFPRLIGELCRETKNVKILITNNRPLGIPSLRERLIHLDPLDFENTVKLFAHICPHLHTLADRKQFEAKVITSKEEGELLPGYKIPEETRLKFKMLGWGIPSQIENAAFRIDKDDLARIKDGTLLRDRGVAQRSISAGEVAGDSGIGEATLDALLLIIATGTEPPVLIASAMICLEAMTSKGVNGESPAGRSGALTVQDVIATAEGALRPAWTVRESCAKCLAQVLAKCDVGVFQRYGFISRVVQSAGLCLSESDFWRVRYSGLGLLESLVTRAGTSENARQQFILETLLPHKEDMLRHIRSSVKDSERQVAARGSNILSLMAWWP